MLPTTPVARLSPPIDGPKDGPSKISLMAEKRAHHSKVEELAGKDRGTSHAQHDIQATPNPCDVGHMSIDIMLPDEILLEVFYLACVDDDYKNRYSWKPTWERLVHVCRRWRYIVFAAPRRLDLRLVYGGGRSVNRMWDVWPALPIVIRTTSRRFDDDNIIAAFKHNDRISGIDISYISCGASLKLGKIMQGPYPALTDLQLSSLGHREFPIRSLGDLGLPHVYDHSIWMASHSQHCRNYFCPPLALPVLPFGRFPLAATFPLRPWSIACLP